MNEEAVEVWTLKDKSVIGMMYKTARYEHVRTSYAKVEDVCKGLNVSMSRDTKCFIENMVSGWTLIYDMLGTPNDIMALKRLANLLNHGLVKERADALRGDVDEGSIVDGLNSLSTIENPSYRAAAYFAYCMNGLFFNAGNFRIAEFITSKILIENGIGIFSVPDGEIDRFESRLSEYTAYGDSASYLDYLVNRCITKD